MKDVNSQRQKHFVDSPVQGALLRQALLYWLMGTIVYTTVVILFRIIPPWLVNRQIDFKTVWWHLGPMVLSSAVLLPLIMYRAVHFSHRFVGPMVRFRQIFRALARGEQVAPIKLRRRDFWKDVASEINEVAARIQEAPAADSRQEASGALREPAPPQPVEV